MIEFKLEGEFIPLISALKATSLVQSGGEAQTLVEGGLVKVNGEIESRKRMKLRDGDKVEVFDKTILIVS